MVSSKLSSKPPLRAVTSADAPANKPKPTTLSAAADSSERDLLVMMRDKISAKIDDGVPPHTLAPLMRQLREIDKEIRSLDARAEDDHDSARAAAGSCDGYDASAI